MPRAVWRMSHSRPTAGNLKQRCGPHWGAMTQTQPRILSFGWQDNTVRWCDRPNIAAANIVADDAAERTPRERAKMLRRVGLRHLVWDWRDEHAMQFDAELDALHDQGINLAGVVCPHPLPVGVSPTDPSVGRIDPHVRQFVTEAARRGLAPDLWVTIEFGEEGVPARVHPTIELSRIWRAADHMEPLARLAADHGMCVLLTNHLGFFGEPAHLVALVEALAERGLNNVGIAYQQQHGHAHIATFAQQLEVMGEHLIVISLSGLDPDGVETGRKILPYGAGRADRKLAHIIAASGFTGQLAIQAHSRDDAEVRLLDGLDGLAWVVARQEGRRHARPTPRIPVPAWPHPAADAVESSAADAGAAVGSATGGAVGSAPAPPVPGTESLERRKVTSIAPDPYTAATHALLKHLESVGFRGAPRSFGWDDKGRHLVEWVEGVRADHVSAPDEALDPHRIGAFLREMHDALESFVPPPDAQWFEGLPSPGADLVIHQDIAPSNIVVTPDDRLVAIDWDAAAPGTRLWDLAHAAHAFAPLHKDGIEPEVCAARLGSFADGYGLTEEEREQLLPLLAMRSERMYEYLDHMRVTGESPWIELWEHGVGAVWRADAQWIREHEPSWRQALLRAA